MIEVEIEAYEEHEQNQTDLTEDRKNLRHRGVKNSVKQCRKHAAKERRPEYQPCGDLAADERLAETSEEHAEYSRRRNDHDQLQNNDQENVLGMAIRRRHGIDLSRGSA